MQRRMLVPIAVVLIATACSDAVAPAPLALRPGVAGASDGPLWQAEELPAGSIVVGMNNARQIAGHINGAGFLWQDSVSTALDFRPVLLNERGQIAGELPGSGGFTPLFVLWEAGSVRPIEIDADRLGWHGSRMLALSEAGDVVGFADAGGPFAIGWRWSNGRTARLAAPRRPESDEVHVGGVNSRGWISGTGVTYEARNELAALWRDTTPEPLPFLDATDNISAAGAINSRGDIIGYSGQFVQDSAAIPGHCCVTRTRAVVWRNGEVADLGAYPGATTFARLVNERGQIAGTASLPTGGVVFLWTDGVTQQMETPTFTRTFSPIAMNERGEIIGGFSSRHWTRDPVVVWVDGRAHDLGPGAPIAINNAGDVLVQRGDPTRGVLWRRVR